MEPSAYLSPSKRLPEDVKQQFDRIRSLEKQSHGIFLTIRGGDVAIMHKIRRAKHRAERLGQEDAERRLHDLREECLELADCKLDLMDLSEKALDTHLRALNEQIAKLHEVLSQQKKDSATRLSEGSTCSISNKREKSDESGEDDERAQQAVRRGSTATASREERGT